MTDFSSAAVYWPAKLINELKSRKLYKAKAYKLDNFDNLHEICQSTEKNFLLKIEKKNKKKKKKKKKKFQIKKWV